ncbi:hypothetical protein BLNAU_6028 [Blattamonas nauphoetae]|uniref:Uncharacterized protein n=1 Tax=Blattamonas nauphoetae TaxID=2049346 RepID=A0ABQ9Y5J0_9EUKA|nr:hypothetical protein BLNAU_6028 [Blattamonas nauphoetae]
MLQSSPLTISSSLFAHCTAESGAGAGIDRAGPCTITDVIFHNNNATDSAGGLDVFLTNNLCQSNCVFENCLGTGMYSEGGAVNLDRVSELTMDSVLFRECRADRGNDLFCYKAGTDHCWLQLKGRTLPNGTYTVKLVGVPEFTFSVSFDGSTGEDTLNMFSSRHSEQLFGAGSKLSFSTKYEVESITFEDNSVLILLDPPRLVFATPAETPRLTSVGTASFKDDSTKDTIDCRLSGTGLSGTSCTLHLLSSSSPPEAVSLPVRFSSNTKTINVVVYSKDANEVKLKYGTNYTLEGMTSGTETCLFQSAFFIQIPAEPTRIEEGRVTLNGAKNEATIRLKGRVLTDKICKLELDSVSSMLTSEATLSETGEVMFKVEINTSSSSILRFGKKYMISSMKIGSESVVVNSDVELAVPNAPIATTTSCSMDAVSNTKFTLSLSGSNLPTSGSFVVSFIGLTQTITVTMNSTGGSSTLIEVSKDTNITFGHTYTISSIIQGVSGGEDEHILSSGQTLRTPDGPSSLSVDSASLNEDDLNSVVLNLSLDSQSCQPESTHVRVTWVEKTRNRRF